MFSLQPHSPVPLVTQIVDGFRRLIDEHTLRPGAKVPSVRQFAASHEVSAFTVADAYDRLVAQGCLVSRPQQGFFVKRRVAEAPRAAGAAVNDFSFDSAWYLRKIFENRQLEMKPGCGWLPRDWLFEDGMKRALRQVSGDNIDLAGYGHPMGLPELRQHLAEALTEHEVVVSPDQVLLTQGSSQALDLVVRRLVRPGDAVLVDSPGYSNLLFILRVQGARLIGVPRTPTGYDLVALEALIAEHRPRLFFTQPRLQSPSGSTATLTQLHRLLQISEKHDLTLVENDLYSDLDPDPRPSLASLDQINRVIYINSFSKTFSPNVRVGYLVAHPDLIGDLAQLKMVAGLTSSELNERLVLAAVTDTRWRRHLKALRERLGQAQIDTQAWLGALGFEVFGIPRAGMCLWARHPALADSAEVAHDAAEHDIMLGPGHLFMPDLQPTDWFRFNVAFCADPRVRAYLHSVIHRSDTRLLGR
jgi:DNA-binding transcriptional MocR family regulator